MNTKMCLMAAELARLREVPDAQFTREDWLLYRSITLSLLYEYCHSWSLVVCFLIEDREALLEGMTVELFADILNEAKKRKVAIGK